MFRDKDKIRLCQILEFTRFTGLQNSVTELKSFFCQMRKILVILLVKVCGGKFFKFLLNKFKVCNWNFRVWKFEDFFAFQILHEINCEKKAGEFPNLRLSRVEDFRQIEVLEKSNK